MNLYVCWADKPQVESCNKVWWCEGFVLKKDQKKDQDEDKISLEDLIEREVAISFFYSSIVHDTAETSAVSIYVRAT